MATGLRSTCMSSVNCIVDAGTRPGLLCEGMINPGCMSSVLVSRKPTLWSATNQKVEVIGIIMLHPRVGETRVCHLFGIVKNLAFPVLFVTYFIDRTQKRAFPAGRKLFPYNLQPVAILIVHEASVAKRITRRTTNVTNGSVLDSEANEQQYVVRVVRTTTLQWISEPPVLVSPKRKRSCTSRFVYIFRTTMAVYSGSCNHGHSRIRRFRILIENVLTFVINLS